jgi:Na+-translocating ferredoxin:NAD+ oxidoreductase subunit B
MNPQSTGREVSPVSRRRFLRDGARAAGLSGLAGLVGVLATRENRGDTVWQLDPNKCLRCDRCATACVLEQSAVKCVHSHAVCGYCRLCTGYFVPDPVELDTGAENQICPTAAIRRTFVEDPYYEYVIDEELCMGCAKCVEGCNRFGNGSLSLQIRQDVCVHCNQCAISVVCPGDAFRRIPLGDPYLLRNAGH